MPKILTIALIVMGAVLLGFTSQQILSFFGFIFHWVGWFFSKLSWLLSLVG